MKHTDFLNGMQLIYSDGVGEFTGYRYQMVEFRDSLGMCLRMELHYPDYPQYDKIVIRDYYGIVDFVDGKRCEASFIGLTLELRGV